LAYLLVWSWEEHKRAAELKKEDPTRSLVLLFDEVEAHLHPKWQRVFLPAVSEVAQTLLLQDSADSVQIIAATHAPLVLGSVETLWDKIRINSSISTLRATKSSLRPSPSKNRAEPNIG